MSAGPRAAITALGMSVPQRVMCNHGFQKFLDTSDEWSHQRTGIRSPLSDWRNRDLRDERPRWERRLPSRPSRRRPAGLTRSTDHLRDDLTRDGLPATACVIQQQTGPGGDPRLLTSRFVQRLPVRGWPPAAGSSMTGMYQRVLVIGAETLSRFSDYTDGAAASCLATGRAAAVLEATTDRKRGVLYSVLKAAAAAGTLSDVPGGGSRTPASHETVDQRLTLHQDARRERLQVRSSRRCSGCWTAWKMCIPVGGRPWRRLVPPPGEPSAIESGQPKSEVPLDRSPLNIDR